MDEHLEIDAAGKVHETRSFADIDAMADLYERMSRVETRNVEMSRRVTSLEDRNRGLLDDDPTKLITSMVVGMLVLQVILPMIMDMVAKWRLQSSSS